MSFQILKHYLSLCLSLLLFSCQKESQQAPNREQDSVSTQSAPITWLALGDSYTIGRGVKENERYPAQAVGLLKAKNISTDSLSYIAESGWTSGDLLKVLKNYYPPKSFNFVSLLIGVNDQYINQDTMGYRQRFRELLSKSIELTQGRKNRVFVISIPDYSVTPFAQYLDTTLIRAQIDWLNEINKSETDKAGCNYIFITDLTREARTNQSLLADGLHPSGLDYNRWAERLVTSMLKVLK